MPEDTITVKLDGRYEGWEAVMDADPDWGSTAFIATGTVAGITQAIAQNLKSWNFHAKDGSPAEPTGDGMRKVSRRAILQLADKWMDEYRALPNS